MQKLVAGVRIGVKRKATEPTQGCRKSQRLCNKNRKLNSDANAEPPPRLFEGLATIDFDINKEEDKVKFLDSLDLIPVPVDMISHSDDSKTEKLRGCQLHNPSRSRYSADEQTPDEGDNSGTWIWLDNLPLEDLKQKKESPPTKKEIQDAVQRLQKIGTSVQKRPTICTTVQMDGNGSLIYRRRLRSSSSV